MRQMMWGDVEADTVHMRPMHAFTAQRVVFSPDRRLLDGMPRPARAGLLSVIAAYLPYYTSEREVLGAVHCWLLLASVRRMKCRSKLCCSSGASLRLTALQ
jgi:hypothetical protein